MKKCTLTKGINKSEAKFLLLIAGFITLFFGILYFTTAKQWIDNLNPLLQFLIMNLGIYFAVFFVFKAIALKKKKLCQGSLGVVFGFISLDIILPEYHVLFDGTLIKGGIFGASASDYAFGYLGQILGLTGIYLWAFVYIFIVLLLMFLAVRMEKDFVRDL